MRTLSRLAFLSVCTVALVGTLTGVLATRPLYAAEGSSRQAVAAPGVEGAFVQGWMASGATGLFTDTVDHAAHHAAAGVAASQTMSGMVMPGATETLSGTAMSAGMGMGPEMMSGMMDNMGGMHGEMQSLVNEIMAQHLDEMKPALAAEMGQLQGRMDVMSGMLAQMANMHDGMMQGGMDGMMQGGMDGMMGDGMMGGTMPMPGTMPM